MNIQILIYFLLINMLVVSCKGPKGITETDNGISNVKSAEDAVKFIESKQVNFTTLEAKVKTRFEDSDKSLSFRTTIRIEKDKQIWVSGGIFGLEAVRVLITPDSIQMINRLERFYYQESIEKVEEISGLPVGFQSLQNLIIGDLLFFNKTNAELTNKEGAFELISQLEQLTTVALLNINSLQLERQTLFDLTSSKKMEINYSNYKTMNDKLFPYESKIHVTGDDELRVDLEFTELELNTNPSFNFSISDRYERKFL